METPVPSLTRRLPFPEALDVLLAATERPEAERRGVAQVLLARWIDHHGGYFTPRSAAPTLGALREAVRAAPWLEPGVAQRVEHLLRGLE